MVDVDDVLTELRQTHTMDPLLFKVLVTICSVGGCSGQVGVMSFSSAPAPRQGVCNLGRLAVTARQALTQS